MAVGVPASRSWIKWAELLKRVFLTDVLFCRLCGGERRLPVRTPARGQAQGDLWDTGLPGLAQPEPVVDDWPPFDFDQRIPDSDLVA